MVTAVTRRRLLAVGAGGLASLAGCQSVLDSEVSTVIHVLNVTGQSQDAYVELSRPDDETFHRGRVLPIENGVVERVDFTVPPGTYRMLLNIDDVEPRPEKTVEWEVTDDECAKQRYWTITPSETGLDLQLSRANCDDSG